jgi:hypothetical protein
MINRIRLLAKSLLPALPLAGPWFREFFDRRSRRYHHRQAIGEARRRREIARHWRIRTRDVVACPDNADITRVPDAGRRLGNDIVMHDGTRIAYGTYGTDDTEHVMRMIEANRGVHEPQEEKVFERVLPLMPPGAVMLELGAFWGFYSLWFARAIAGARCFLVEPTWAHLNAGRLNFLLNGAAATFIHAAVGESPRRPPGKPPIVSVDRLLRDYRIERVHLLHSDIQGFELEMLRGAAGAFDEGRVDFAFLSTHSNPLHAECRGWLQRRGWRILADANLDESYSVDGLLVAHRPGLSVAEFPSISHRPSR